MMARSCFATAALILGTATVPALGQVHNDMIEDLPEGPGRETVFYTCTACHGVRIITQQGLSAERWDVTIDFMVERHGMPAPTDGTRREIADYLAAHFPSRQKGYTNPFLKK
jgi:hypothetical protein